MDKQPNAKSDKVLIIGSQNAQIKMYMKLLIIGSQNAQIKMYMKLATCPQIYTPQQQWNNTTSPSSETSSCAVSDSWDSSTFADQNGSLNTAKPYEKKKNRQFSLTVQQNI